MYIPSLPLLRQVVHPAILEAVARPIKHSSTPATVYRVQLTHGRGAASAPTQLILKRMAPDWPDDAHGHEREARFYATFWPQLELGDFHVYYAGPEPGSAYHLVIMDDLTLTHSFPLPTHTWTQVEIEAIVRIYARLHVRGAAALPAAAARNWLLPRHETRVWENAGNLLRLAADLSDWGIWPALPGLMRLLRQTLDRMTENTQLPVTLLHNDVYPPNIGLPCRDQGDVVLLDWEMLGWGLAEMDLAFMFLQPYGSHRHLQRQAALAAYWQERARLGDATPSLAERQARQQYADTLWALWLIPVAHRMAAAPFPPGSTPRHYWDAMFPVLGERLYTLTNNSPD